MAEAAVARAELWRNERRRSRSQENRFMLELGPFHDVGFFVGPPEGEQHLITCHKLMMARCSEVFSAMFFGGAEVFTYDDECAIPVPDVTFEAFETMVEYVYSGELFVEKFEVGCGVMFAAKKYRLPDLEAKCRSFLWSRLFPANVWRGLEFAAEHQEPQIYSTAVQILQRKTSYLLEHKSFEKATQQSLVTLLEQDYLTVSSELELYEACLRWAMNDVSSRGLPANPETLAEALGPAIKLIRFLTFKPKDFSAIGNEILSESDIESLKEDVVLEEYCTIILPRFTPTHETFFTIGFNDECCQIHIEKEYFENTYDVFAMAFSSNGDFCSTQLGVRIPTQVKPANATGDTYDEDITILMYDWSLEEMLSTTRFTAHVNYDTILDIPFTEKVQIKRKRFRKVVKVIFHKSGIYPSRYRMAYDRDSEVKRCTFAGTPDVELWHEKTYTYVHFCAYTIDKDIESKEEIQACK